MREVNDNTAELGPEARRVLREALRALELHRTDTVIGNKTHCLATDRVRRLAAVAAAASVHEQRHALGCKRCRSRIRAFQGAKETTADRMCEASLQTARIDASVPSRWIALAEDNARALFDVLCCERAADESPAASWLVSHVVAQELWNACNDGVSASVSAHLLGTSLGAVAAVAHDILSAWSYDFDAAWPMFELLREAAKEACFAGEFARDQFVRGYVRIAVGAPTHLKAVLVDGIDSLAYGAPDGVILAADIRTEMIRTDPSPSTAVLLALPAMLSEGAGLPGGVDHAIESFVAAARDASDVLHRAIANKRSIEELAELIATTLASFLEHLSPSEDAGTPLLQLSVIRWYLAIVLVGVRDTGSDAREVLVNAAARPLVEYARDPRSSPYVAMAACRGFAEDAFMYAKVLSAMLAAGRPELHHAVVVALRQAYLETGSPAHRFVGVYEHISGAWIFTTDAPRPFDAPAGALAELVNTDPELADSFAWFNHRLEPTVKNNAFSSDGWRGTRP